MSNKFKYRKEVILTKWNIDIDNLICTCLYNILFVVIKDFMNI